MPTSTHRMVSWLDVGPTSSLLPCLLILTRPDPNTDLQTDFSVGSWTYLITTILLYDLHSRLDWPPSQGPSCSPHSGTVGWAPAEGGSALPTLGSPAAPGPGGAALLLMLTDMHAASCNTFTVYPGAWAMQRRQIPCRSAVSSVSPQAEVITSVQLNIFLAEGRTCIGGTECFAMAA